MDRQFPLLMPHRAQAADSCLKEQSMSRHDFDHAVLFVLIFTWSFGFVLTLPQLICLFETLVLSSLETIGAQGLGRSCVCGCNGGWND